ncbi:MAG TPA: redoxin domain-containing protein [Patescibacteria group bacterium]|nr:redoxin domain-containing protein [Patescibacteria group bacterium]
MHKRMAILLGLLLCAATLGAAGGRLAAQGDNKEAPPEPKIKVGDMAPDFTLLDQSRKPVSLHDFRGKKTVALAFYVFAFTGG